MYDFILDVITARGWSMRHLGELTGISYSGIRDYLKGLPQRLSKDRINRVHELLDLDEQGRLKPHTLYAWQVRVQEECLGALDRVLLNTIKQYSKPNASGIADRFDALIASAFPTTTNSHHQFAAIPLFGGDTEGLPAPYWVLCWKEIYLLIQWRLPPTRRIKKIPDFYAQQDLHYQDLPLVNPDIKTLSAACWAPGMELSPQKAQGIRLTPAQLHQLKKSETTESLKLETLKDWLQAETFEDPFWALMHNKPGEPTEDVISTKDFSDEENLFDISERQQEPPLWTWDMVLQKLKQRYSRPEEVVRILKLK
jgi:transcriptional regulator with XRE-family HTH domain